MSFRKESLIRKHIFLPWSIEPLRQTHIAIFDWDSDLFDFSHVAKDMETKAVVTTNHNKKVNKSATYPEITGKELWEYMKRWAKGSIKVEIPAQHD